jgi:hypothetical protein
MRKITKSNGEEIEMKESMIWTLLVIMMSIVALAAYIASQGVTSIDFASNGPFRDGIYLGTLDAKNRKMPNLASGRWSSDSDRQSFIQGYKTAYAQTQALLNQNSGSNPNTSAAYRDGRYLGKLDAEQGRAQRPGVGRWVQLQDKELFVFGYHQAYLDETASLRAGGPMVRASLVH